jgi:hypothetical protein
MKTLSTSSASLFLALVLFGSGARVASGQRRVIDVHGHVLPFPTTPGPVA